MSCSCCNSIAGSTAHMLCTLGRADRSPCSVNVTSVNIHLPVSKKCKLSYTHLSVAKDGAIVAFQQTLSHLMCTGGIDMVLPSALKDAIKL